MTYVELDVSKFGGRELRMLSNELDAYFNRNKAKLFGNIDKIGFNGNSGNVFLIDSDYCVAMTNGDTLEDFISCPDCGEEGFLSEFDTTNECCKEYHEELNK